MNNIDLIIKTPNPKIGDHIELEIPLPIKELEVSKLKIDHSFTQGEVSENGLALLNEPQFLNGKITLKLVSYKTGEIKIEPIIIKQDEEIIFETQSVTINVQGVAQGQKELELIDIKAPKEISTPFYYYIGYGIFIAAVLLVLWIVYKKYFRKGKIKKSESKLEEYISPYQKAIKTLNNIESDTEIKNNARVYVTKVSEVLRRFIEEEYDICIMELTTTEIIRIFKKKQIFTNSIIEDLKKYFTSSDLIKFSELPWNEELDFISKTREFINKLRVSKDEI